MLRAGTKKISRHYCRKHRPELLGERAMRSGWMLSR
nr:DUF1661 domain-containing protein [Porphyromonas gulae]